MAVWLQGISSNHRHTHTFSFSPNLTPTSMLAKFDIDYVIRPQHNKRKDTHRTDDPIAAEDFLIGLLATGAHVISIKHEGVELARHQSDQMLRVAAERLVSGLLCRSLDLDAADVKHRFGFAA